MVHDLREREFWDIEETKLTKCFLYHRPTDPINGTSDPTSIRLRSPWRPSAKLMSNQDGKYVLSKKVTGLVRALGKMNWRPGGNGSLIGKVWNLYVRSWFTM